MNRFRRLLLIAAINDYDPFPPPLFSADLRAYVYICTRETMERALRNGRRKLEREKEREGFRTASNNGEERSYSSRKNGGRRLDPFSKPCPLQFPTFSFPRDTGTGMKSSVRD